MKRKAKRVISSCFQCIAIKSCYGCSHPDMGREEARSRASACSSLRKGFSNDIITVAGSDRGISRKNAEKMVSNGEAVWIGHETIEKIDGGSKN